MSDETEKMETEAIGNIMTNENGTGSLKEKEDSSCSTNEENTGTDKENENGVNKENEEDNTSKSKETEDEKLDESESTTENTNNKEEENSSEQTNGNSEDTTAETKESESSSAAAPVRRNVAKRGRKRKLNDTVPQRETPRRAARRVKTYTDDAFNEIDEIEGPDDPDYNFSDSDDDPDFDPSRRKNTGSPELDIRPKRKTQRSSGSEGSNSASATPSKRRGRPNVYSSDLNSTQENDSNEADPEKKSPGKLSSAYNYAVSRTRQNQAIRLPEGPDLSDDQMKIIESQFKSGDFVMAKKDIEVTDHPPIWRIDGKSLLQKFQSFEKDSKILYRNISTYSGWTSQAKALYVPVKVKFVFQSRYDTVVEFMGFKGDQASEDERQEVVDKPVWLPKNKQIEEFLIYMGSFEIFLQTLISQALDHNFLQEIYDEKDDYFVEKVKAIDDLTLDRREKILKMTQWDDKFQDSLNLWPCVNTMVTKSEIKCQACGEKDATMLSQFYGQPYDKLTLRSVESTAEALENKNFVICDSCSTLSLLFSKVTHQKYDFFSQCKSTVTNMRVSQPNKTTTNVLRDLLANDEWISGLFRSMCTMWTKVDSLMDMFNLQPDDAKNLSIISEQLKNQEAS